MMRPDHFRDVLGATFVNSSHEVVLQLGKQRYDRWRLAEIGVPQLKAARTLHLVLQRLAITTPTQLTAHLADLTSFEGVGLATFYTALAVLADAEQEAAALAGYTKAALRPNGHTVTFTTLKAHARDRAKQHAKDTNPRQRRDK